MSEHLLSAGELSLVLSSIKDYAIFTFSPQGNVTMWNDGAERVFGSAAAEILGRSAEIVFTPEDRAQGAPQREMRAAATTGHAADERVHLRKDCGRFYCSGLLFPLRDGSSEMKGFVKVCRDLSDRQQWERAVLEERDSLESRVAERTEQLSNVLDERRTPSSARRVLSRLITVQDDERRRIAPELHDHLGQQVTAIHLTIESLKGDAKATSNGLAKRVDDLHALFKQLDKDLDFFTWELGGLTAA
jgi:PAS domain S-box-containing protein